MAYAYNPEHSEELELNFDEDFIPNFENGEILNELELMVMEIGEMILGDRFLYCPQVPLGVICSHSGAWLPNGIWKFWVNSRIDITLIERRFRASRKAKLAIECQSHYHDSLEAQIRDRKKAKLLELVNVPLIYIRPVDNDRRFYRFYTPDEQTEVFYNIITQEGRTELELFLKGIVQE